MVAHAWDPSTQATKQLNHELEKENHLKEENRQVDTRRQLANRIRRKEQTVLCNRIQGQLLQVMGAAALSDPHLIWLKPTNKDIRSSVHIGQTLCIHPIPKRKTKVKTMGTWKRKHPHLTAQTDRPNFPTLFPRQPVRQRQQCVPNYKEKWTHTSVWNTNKIQYKDGHCWKKLIQRSDQNKASKWVFRGMKTCTLKKYS